MSAVTNAQSSLPSPPSLPKNCHFEPKTPPRATQRKERKKEMVLKYNYLSVWPPPKPPPIPQLLPHLELSIETRVRQKDTSSNITTRMGLGFCPTSDSKDCCKSMARVSGFIYIDFVSALETNKNVDYRIHVTCVD